MAKGKRSGKPNCSRGYSCGATCINTKKSCQNPLEGQGKDYAGWIKNQIGSGKFDRLSGRHQGAATSIVLDKSGGSDALKATLKSKIEQDGFDSLTEFEKGAALISGVKDAIDEEDRQLEQELQDAFSDENIAKYAAEQAEAEKRFQQELNEVFSDINIQQIKAQQQAAEEQFQREMDEIFSDKNIALYEQEKKAAEERFQQEIKELFDDTSIQDIKERQRRAEELFQQEIAELFSGVQEKGQLMSALLQR